MARVHRTVGTRIGDDLTFVDIDVEHVYVDDGGHAGHGHRFGGRYVGAVFVGQIDRDDRRHEFRPEGMGERAAVQCARTIRACTVTPVDGAACDRIRPRIGDTAELQAVLCAGRRRVRPGHHQRWGHIDHGQREGMGENDCTLH